MTRSINEWAASRASQGFVPTTDRMIKRSLVVEKLVLEANARITDPAVLWTIVKLPVKEKNFDFIAKLLLRCDGTELLTTPRWDTDITLINDLRIVRRWTTHKGIIPDVVPSTDELDARYRSLVAGIKATDSC